jgi:hypothetical protein
VTNTTSSPDSASSSKQVFGLPRWAVLGGLALVALTVVFLAGVVVGRAPAPELRERAEAAELAESQALDQVQALEGRLHGEQALTLLYRGLIDLDARNFGTANERIDAAVNHLGQVDAAAMGADARDFEALRERLGELDIRVAADMAEQRNILTGLAQELNALLGEGR